MHEDKKNHEAWGKKTEKYIYNLEKKLFNILIEVTNIPNSVNG